MCKEGTSSRSPAAGALDMAGDKVLADLWVGGEQLSCDLGAVLVALRAVTATA